jgi:hypothetical protein
MSLSPTNPVNFAKKTKRAKNIITVSNVFIWLSMDLRMGCSILSLLPHHFLSSPY